MSTSNAQASIPQKYRPSKRLIDQPDKLHELYVEKDYTIREIAASHADVSHTRVYEALVEYEIGGVGTANSESHGDDHATNGRRGAKSSTTTSHGERGVDPPGEGSVDWSSARLND